MLAFDHAAALGADVLDADMHITFAIFSTLRLEHVLTPAYQSLQAPESNSGIAVLAARLIVAARNRNVRVQPWTINSEADLRRVLALGVDGVNTDFPDRLLSILGR